MIPNVQWNNQNLTNYNLRILNWIIPGFKDQKTLENLALIKETMNDVQQEKFPFLQHPGNDLIKFFFTCNSSVVMVKSNFVDILQHLVLGFIWKYL